MQPPRLEPKRPSLLEELIFKNFTLSIVMLLLMALLFVGICFALIPPTYGYL